jgi:hypothetical protein
VIPLSRRASAIAINCNRRYLFVFLGPFAELSFGNLHGALIDFFGVTRSTDSCLAPSSLSLVSIDQWSCNESIEGRETIQECPCIEIVPGAGESITIPAQSAAFLNIERPVAKRRSAPTRLVCERSYLASASPPSPQRPLVASFARLKVENGVWSRGTIVYDDTKVQSAA